MSELGASTSAQPARDVDVDIGVIDMQPSGSAVSQLKTILQGLGSMGATLLSAFNAGGLLVDDAVMLSCFSGVRNRDALGDLIKDNIDFAKSTIPELCEFPLSNLVNLLLAQAPHLFANWEQPRPVSFLTSPSIAAMSLASPPPRSSEFGCSLVNGRSQPKQSTFIERQSSVGDVSEDEEQEPEDGGLLTDAEKERRALAAMKQNGKGKLVTSWGMPTGAKRITTVRRMSEYLTDCRGIMSREFIKNHKDATEAVRSKDKDKIKSVAKSLKNGFQNEIAINSTFVPSARSVEPKCARVLINTRYRLTKDATEKTLRWLQLPWAITNGHKFKPKSFAFFFRDGNRTTFPELIVKINRISAEHNVAHVNVIMRGFYDDKEAEYEDPLHKIIYRFEDLRAPASDLCVSLDCLFEFDDEIRSIVNGLRALRGEKRGFRLYRLPTAREIASYLAQSVVEHAAYNAYCTMLENPLTTEEAVAMNGGIERPSPDEYFRTHSEKVAEVLEEVEQHQGRQNARKRRRERQAAVAGEPTPKRAATNKSSSAVWPTTPPGINHVATSTSSLGPSSSTAASTAASPTSLPAAANVAPLDIVPAASNAALLTSSSSLLPAAANVALSPAIMPAASTAAFLRPPATSAASASAVTRKQPSKNRRPLSVELKWICLFWASVQQSQLGVSRRGRGQEHAKFIREICIILRCKQPYVERKLEEVKICRDELHGPPAELAVEEHASTEGAAEVARNWKDPQYMAGMIRAMNNHNKKHPLGSSFHSTEDEADSSASSDDGLTDKTFERVILPALQRKKLQLIRSGIDGATSAIPDLLQQPGRLPLETASSRLQHLTSSRPRQLQKRPPSKKFLALNRHSSSDEVDGSGRLIQHALVGRGDTSTTEATGTDEKQQQEPSPTMPSELMPVNQSQEAMQIEATVVDEAASRTTPLLLPSDHDEREAIRQKDDTFGLQLLAVVANEELTVRRAVSRRSGEVGQQLEQTSTSPSHLEQDVDSVLQLVVGRVADSVGNGALRPDEQALPVAAGGSVANSDREASSSRLSIQPIASPTHSSLAEHPQNLSLSDLSELAQYLSDQDDDDFSVEYGAAVEATTMASLPHLERGEEHCVRLEEMVDWDNYAVTLLEDPLKNTSVPVVVDLHFEVVSGTLCTYKDFSIAPQDLQHAFEFVRRQYYYQLGEDAEVVFIPRKIVRGRWQGSILLKTLDRSQGCSKRRDSTGSTGSGGPRRRSLDQLYNNQQPFSSLVDPSAKSHAPPAAGTAGTDDGGDGQIRQLFRNSVWQLILFYHHPKLNTFDDAELFEKFILPGGFSSTTLAAVPLPRIRCLLSKYDVDFEEEPKTTTKNRKSQLKRLFCVLSVGGFYQLANTGHSEYGMRFVDVVRQLPL